MRTLSFGAALICCAAVLLVVLPEVQSTVDMNDWESHLISRDVVKWNANNFCKKSGKLSFVQYSESPHPKYLRLENARKNKHCQSSFSFNLKLFDAYLISSLTITGIYKSSSDFLLSTLHPQSELNSFTKTHEWSPFSIDLQGVVRDPSFDNLPTGYLGFESYLHKGFLDFQIDVSTKKNGKSILFDQVVLQMGYYSAQPHIVPPSLALPSEVLQMSMSNIVPPSQSAVLQMSMSNMIPPPSASPQ